MTAQSWVETTLPPGYTVIHSWAGRGWVWQTNERQGWNATKAETCRSAWRHWTAAVLRGRDVEWYHDEHANPQAEGVDAVIGIYASVIGRRKVALVSLRCADKGVDAYDIDEAMARFAALVLATEGPR